MVSYNHQLAIIYFIIIVFLEKYLYGFSQLVKYSKKTPPKLLILPVIMHNYLTAQKIQRISKSYVNIY